MVFLCLNCGKIASNEAITGSCEECGEEYKIDLYADVISYARQSVHYGYDYRLTYEQQLSVRGSINGKYSLIQPNDVWQLIAAAILTGVAYDALKYIVKQVINLITNSPAGTNPEYDKILSVITDSDKLKQFVTYIQEYHLNTMDTPKPVIEAIDEEKRADLLGSKVEAKVAEAIASGEELSPKKMAEISMQASREVFRQGIVVQYNGPSQQQLDGLLLSLKRRTEQLKVESLGDCN